MILNFNGLTGTEIEVLSLIAEEAAEVVQAVTKTLRHGLGSYNPDDKRSKTNQQHLEKELGDLRAALWLGMKYKLIADRTIGEHADKKIRKVGKYLHHANTKGCF